MDFNFNNGKIVPMFLAEDGNVYPIVFKSIKQAHDVEQAVIRALDCEVTVDTEVQINDEHSTIKLCYTK